MSVSASLDLNIVGKKDVVISAMDIIKCFTENNWTLRNNGKISYLPLGDDELFDWQTNNLSDLEIIKIIQLKEMRKEVIGIEITWKDTYIGGNLLIKPNANITFCICINRQTLLNNVTNANWYLERILPCFNDSNIILESFVFSQY